MQNKKITIVLGSLGSLSLVAVPLSSVSFISNKQSNEEYTMSEKNFIVAEANVKPSLQFINKDIDNVNFEDSNFQVNYLGSINEHPVFEIYSKINSLYYVYLENKWNISSWSKDEKTKFTKLILQNLDSKVVFGTREKTFDDYSDNIYFNIGQNDVTNIRNINFLSSWGVMNHGTGEATVDTSLDFSRIYDSLVMRTNQDEPSSKITKIYNEHLVLQDLYLLPVINEYNPPIRDGHFLLTSTSSIEWSQIYGTPQLDMILPKGGGKGLEWYSGIAQIGRLGIPVVDIIMGFLFRDAHLAVAGAVDLFTTVMEELKHESAGTPSGYDIKKALDNSILEQKNKVIIKNNAIISNRNDKLDMDLVIDSFAEANATGLFGDRTQANIKRVVGAFVDPKITYQYVKFNYRDF